MKRLPTPLLALICAGFLAAAGWAAETAAPTADAANGVSEAKTTQLFTPFTDPKYELYEKVALSSNVVIALAGRTDRQALESLLSVLQRIRANVVGLVLNETRHAAGKGYRYYGYSARSQS